MRYARVSEDLKEDFRHCYSPGGREEKHFFFWVGDSGCSGGISSASTGSKLKVYRSKGFQLSLGKLAFLSGNYNLSIFGEQGFLQPRNSSCIAFPCEQESSEKPFAVGCWRLIAKSSRGWNHVRSTHIWGEPGALNWGLGCYRAKVWSVKSLLSLEQRMGPSSFMPQQLLLEDKVTGL